MKCLGYCKTCSMLTKSGGTGLNDVKDALPADPERTPWQVVRLPTIFGLEGPIGHLLRCVSWLKSCERLRRAADSTKLRFEFLKCIN